MEALYPQGFSFIHDRLRPHTCCEEEMEEEEFGQVLFPTYSPDLNPIENLWSALNLETHLLMKTAWKRASGETGKS